MSLYLDTSFPIAPNTCVYEVPEEEKAAPVVIGFIPPRETNFLYQMLESALSDYPDLKSALYSAIREARDFFMDARDSYEVKNLVSKLLALDLVVIYHNYRALPCCIPWHSSGSYGLSNECLLIHIQKLANRFNPLLRQNILLSFLDSNVSAESNSYYRESFNRELFYDFLFFAQDLLETPEFGDLFEELHENLLLRPRRFSG